MEAELAELVGWVAQRDCSIQPAFRLVGDFDFGSAFGLLHEEGEGDKEGGGGDEDPEDIDVGEGAGLGLGHAVDLRAGA